MAPPSTRAHPARGPRLERIARRGSTDTVRYRRAMMIPASSSGDTVPVITRLVAADERTVREIIHAFNARQWF